MKQGYKPATVFLCILVILFLALLCTACSVKNGMSDASSALPGNEVVDAPEQQTPNADEEGSEAEDSFTEIESEPIPMAVQPPISTDLMPSAPGTLVKSNAKATVDYSNTASGYVMIQYNSDNGKKVKVLVTTPGATTYTYTMSKRGAYEVFPLSGGSGTYSVGVYENTSGNKYATVLTLSQTVSLSDEFAPFLLPNQYVNYSTTSKAVSLAAELVSGATTTLDKITNIYNYIIKNISYDKELAQSVKSGYLPDIDQVLAKKKGICFDYASLMTAMLRSQGIPTKLVVGNAGSVYHAWISTYVEEVGWVDGIIYFNGNEWKLMDPTFASSGNSSESIMEYIGNGANYSAKYLY